MQTTSQILEYRNGIYQGYVKNYKRHGRGILISDDGLILIGTWKNDQLFGKTYIQYNNQEYGFGEANRSQFQGYFLFRKRDSKSLFVQFNSSKPINQSLLIDKETSKVQVLSYKSPIYQVQKQIEIQVQNLAESDLIQKMLNKKVYTPELYQYLQQFNDTFTCTVLSNGSYIFLWNDQKNPISLGFVFNKNGLITSYGSYVNNKLHGLGCKFQNNIRYQGMFLNGYIHGIGMKYSKGKYSFGKFQQGNLVQAVLLQERSQLSLEKLKLYKKNEHIRSIYFCNSYVRSNGVKFKGFKQIIYEKQIKTQYVATSPRKKQTKNLALKLIQQQRDDYDTKSSKSFLNKKNPQDDVFSEAGKSFHPTGLSMLKKFNI